jgi:hypothetical protein
VQNAAGLYGFHNPPGHNARSTEFAKLYTGQPADLLISCARWSTRYAALANPFLQWLAEMKEIGDLIGYAGPVIGFDLSSLLGGEERNIGADESAYCEFVLDAGGALSIGCSLTSNTTATMVHDTGTTIRRIAANKSSSVPYKGHVFSNIVSNSGGFTSAAAGKGTYQVSV